MANKTEICLPGYDGKATLINYTECNLRQLKAIWILRNIPEVRECMVNQSPIDWYQHIDFVETLYDNQAKEYLAVFMGETLVGTYNLTRREDNTWERGLITSPKYQGTGVTATIEKEILEALPPEKYSVITAKVKHTNLRSLKYHEKAGYKFDGRSDDYVLYKKELK